MLDFKEQIAELYIATFDRAPDADGLAYWDGTGVEIDGTIYKTDLTNLEDIVAAMLETPEAQEIYGDPTSPDFNKEAFITNIYENVLNREPDEAGLAYWLSDKTPLNKMIIAIINGAKSETGNPEDRALLENKVKAGLAFTEAGLNDKDLAKKIMDEITPDPKSVDKVVEEIGTKATPSDKETISITEDGTTIASDDKGEIFDISTDSTYSHEIENFDTKNDKLDFGSGITSKDINIINTEDDGKVDLIYAVDGGEKVITITLTGLSHDEDLALTTSDSLDSILM